MTIHRITQLYFIMASLNIFGWITLCAMTLGGIFWSQLSIVLNIAMGCVFLFIGIFFYLRTHYLKKILGAINSGDKLNRVLLKYLYLESLFVLMSCLFVFVLNTAAYSRVFLEQLPLFG